MKCGAWKSLMRRADRILICDPGSYFVTRVTRGNSREWRPQVPGVRSHGSLRHHLPAHQKAQTVPSRCPGS